MSRQPLPDSSYPHGGLICMKHPGFLLESPDIFNLCHPFFPGTPEGVIPEQDRYDNHHSGGHPPCPCFYRTAAFLSSNRCNVAKHCLIVSRLKTALNSSRITVISGNIVSPKQGERQKRYNRVFYGPGFSPGRTGVIREDNGKTPSHDPPTSRIPAAPSCDRCNVAKHGLKNSRLKTGICSRRITVISGNMVSPKKRVRQKRYNRAFYGPGISPTGTGVILMGLLPPHAPEQQSLPGMQSSARFRSVSLPGRSPRASMG